MKRFTIVLISTVEINIQIFVHFCIQRDRLIVQIKMVIKISLEWVIDSYNYFAT